MNKIVYEVHEFITYGTLKEWITRTEFSSDYRVISVTCTAYPSWMMVVVVETRGA